jgi:2-polyprenyl-3-methyl-5-hydroxy-6-metoxy-1,4-benzoquinol methylase
MKRRRRTRRLARLVRDAAIDLGILPYRPASRSVAEWDRSYESNDLEYLAGLGELPRYSVIVGYICWLGGRPKVLDVGCGEGLLRVRMASVPFDRYVGVDLSPVAIAKARRLEDDRTHFAVGGPEAAGARPFDIVVLNEILSIVDDPEALLRAAIERLAPGGYALSSNWRHAGDRMLWRLLDRHMERVDVVNLLNPANRTAPKGVRVGCHRLAKPAGAEA